MEVIVIDPETRKVYYDEIKSNLASLHMIMQCKESSTPIQLPNGDVLNINAQVWVDDVFRFYGYGPDIHGKAVLVGTGNGGEAVDVQSTVEEIKAKVKFQGPGK